MRIPCLKLLFIVGIFYSTVVFGGSAKELFDLANEAYTSGQYDRALELFDQMITYYPAFAPAYNAKGIVYVALEKPQEAIYYFKRVTDLEPQNAQAFDSLGKAYYATKEFDLAEAAFKKALELDPNLKSVYFSLGWVYLLGNPKPMQAISYFKRVLETNPTLTAAIYGLGLGYLSDKNRLKVLEIITELHQMKQDNLAGQLETMLRENRYELVPPKLSSPKPSLTSGESFEPDYSEPTGVPVRLRGKLQKRD